jgi:hypothetical protein
MGVRRVLPLSKTDSKLITHSKIITELTATYLFASLFNSDTTVIETFVSPVYKKWTNDNTDFLLKSVKSTLLQLSAICIRQHNVNNRIQYITQMKRN